MAEEDRLSFLVQYRDKFATDCQRVFRGFQVQPLLYSPYIAPI